MDDNQIIALFFRRDEQALDECRTRYGHYLRTVLYNILRSDEDVEECSDDVLMAAWGNIPPTRPQSLKNYLASLARNIAIDRYRASNRSKRGGSTLELLDEITSMGFGESPENAAVSKAMIAEINKFLSLLDKDTRVCFVLRYYYAKTNEEIAGQTGKTTHAVASLLSKTRARLKEYLNAAGFGD